MKAGLQLVGKIFRKQKAGIRSIKVSALYYEAAKLAANVIKRFNTKEFAPDFFSMNQ